MKLTLENIFKYIDDYIRDKSRINYPIEERIRDINYNYFNILDDIDRYQGIKVSNTDTDANFNEISLNIGEDKKPLAETTEVSFVSLEYDGMNYDLKELYFDNTKDISDLEEWDNTRPTHYVLRGNTIQILPKPDKVVKIKLYQSYRPSEFVDTNLTAVPRIHEAIHMLLVLKCAEQYFTKRDMAIPRQLILDIANLEAKKKQIYSPTRQIKMSVKSKPIR